MTSMTEHWQLGVAENYSEVDGLREKVRSLNMALTSVGEAICAATGVPADGLHHELAMERLAELGEMRAKATNE